MNRILNEVKNNVLTDESKWCQQHFAVEQGRKVGVGNGKHRY